jgi:molybdopterin converting factor small subunit
MDAMKVHVQLYSRLRDLAGIETVDLDIADGAKVSDVLERLYQRFPVLRVHDKNILTGAGVEFVDRDYKVQAGEEISIMPPVQGG